MKLLKNNKNIDLENLFRITQRPEVFSYSDRRHFWDDEHISKNMLEAHLNPDWDAASRKHETIKKSCDWLVNLLKLDKKMKLIDLGCGPGLYCTNFYNHGLQVTGVDFSKRSIDYAKKYAQNNSMNIEYLYRDYLRLDYKDEFDIATLVLYDFTCFSPDDSKKLLSKVHSLLVKDGYFAFDIETPYSEKTHVEWRKWTRHDNGFWKPCEYIELHQRLYYQSCNTRLDQHIIIEKNGDISDYRLWQRHYTLEEITKMLEDSGFIIKMVFSDLIGSTYEPKSKSIGIIAQKNSFK